VPFVYDEVSVHPTTGTTEISFANIDKWFIWHNSQWLDWNSKQYSKI